MIKSILLFFSWLSAGAMAVLAVLLFIAPYLASVIANIGRRPVVLATRRAAPRMQPARRSTAH